MLVLCVVTLTLRPWPQPWVHLLPESSIEMAIATCSPWGFPEMPRTSGSFMPDTVQGKASSVSSSYKKAHQGHITTHKCLDWAPDDLA